MPLDDDGDDDAPVFGAPLPPEDRLWRHPSELAAFGGGPVGPSAPPAATARAGTWGVAIVSGLVGAVLTVGVVSATVGVGTDRGRTAVERVSGRPLSAALVSSSVPGSGADTVARALQRSVARLVAGPDDRVGSAFVLRDDGYLLTTADLVGNATAVAVMLDGTELAGTVVGTDHVTDVAVVHVDRTGLEPAVLDDGSGAVVGERAFVVTGAASGTPPVTAGVIGATDRQVTAADGTTLHGMVQTDAPVDEAALGGPLSDERGVVIGLMATSSGNGGGHAVPVATAQRVGDDIAATGAAHHVWLGVEGTDLAADQAAGMDVTGGASITKVADASPAAAAGLRGGDVITAVDGRPVASMSALVVCLRVHRPGDAVTVEYWRDGERRTASATLAERSG